MAKLEEISELLVSEIRDFEEAVKRLEEIQKTKLTIDISELKNLFRDQKEVLKNHDLRAQHIYDLIEKLNKESKFYPNWALTVFIVSLVLNIILISSILL